MENDLRVIADTSFYLCFIEDICQPATLVKIINTFDFYYSNIIEEEVDFDNIEELRGHRNLIGLQNFVDFGQILKPFFSQEEIKKGEHEVIGMSFLFVQLGLTFIFILDDAPARKFVTHKIPQLVGYMHGTAGFLGICCCTYLIFTKEEIYSLLHEIEHSDFFITKNVINTVIERVRSC